MKKLCAFCMKEHKNSVPNLCRAKADVINSYVKALGPGNEWKVFAGVHSGVIDLEGEALKLLYKEGKQP